MNGIWAGIFPDLHKPWRLPFWAVSSMIEGVRLLCAAVWAENTCSGHRGVVIIGGTRAALQKRPDCGADELRDGARDGEELSLRRRAHHGLQHAGHHDPGGRGTRADGELVQAALASVWPRAGCYRHRFPSWRSLFFSLRVVLPEPRRAARLLPAAVPPLTSQTRAISADHWSISIISGASAGVCAN